MRKETINIYVLTHNVSGEDNSAIKHTDRNHSMYYPPYKNACCKLKQVFGDKYEYTLLNKSDPDFIPEEGMIDILVVPEKASFYDIWFGYLWQKTKPGKLVIFNSDYLLKREIVRDFTDEEIKIYSNYEECNRKDAIIETLNKRIKAQNDMIELLTKEQARESND